MTNKINDEKDFNPWIEFATKQEVYIIDEKVDELIKGSAGMSAAIEGLTKSVDSINNNLQVLITNKGIFDGILRYGMKCVVFLTTFIGGMTTLHFVGLIKIFGNWLLS